MLESGTQVAIGLLVGLTAALAASKVIQRFLFGISPVDAVAIAAVVAMLLAAGLVASLGPAIRAAQVPPMRVLRTVMRRGVLQLAIGLALGLGAAFAATGAMRSLLVGVEPSDPLTFIVTAIVLLAVGLVACWLPANRAATIPPVQALAQTGE